MKISVFFMSFLIGLAAQAGELQIKVGPNPATALPVGIDSCTGASELAKPSFDYTTFELEWQGGALNISQILVDFKNDSLVGGQYQCAIAGDELAAVLFPKDSQVSENGKIILKASCGIRCGGVSMRPEVLSLIMTGTLTVIGAEVAYGKTYPISKSVPVSLQYTKP